MRGKSSRSGEKEQGKGKEGEKHSKNEVRRYREGGREGKQTAKRKKQEK